jgi:hypothetical protein
MVTSWTKYPPAMEAVGRVKLTCQLNEPQLAAVGPLTLPMDSLVGGLAGALAGAVG